MKRGGGNTAISKKKNRRTHPAVAEWSKSNHRRIMYPGNTGGGDWVNASAHKNRCTIIIIIIVQYTLTAEYDGRCRAHDAEERAVNWISVRAAHFVRRHEIGLLRRVKRVAE